MWSTPSDRAQAEERAARERQARETARTAGLSIEDRLDRWIDEEPGEETEEVIDLIVDVRDELVRRKAVHS